MKALFYLLGAILIVGGIALGIYLGVFIGLIGGITKIIDAFKATPVDSSAAAMGFVQVFFADVMGIGSAVICWMLGMGCFAIGSNR
jgi:uncharacterized membrane protein